MKQRQSLIKKAAFTELENEQVSSCTNKAWFPRLWVLSFPPCFYSKNFSFLSTSSLSPLTALWTKMWWFVKLLHVIWSFRNTDWSAGWWQKNRLLRLGFGLSLNGSTDVDLFLFYQPLPGSLLDSSSVVEASERAQKLLGWTERLKWNQGHHLLGSQFQLILVFT